MERNWRWRHKEESPSRRAQTKPKRVSRGCSRCSRVYGHMVVQTVTPTRDRDRGVNSRETYFAFVDKLYTNKIG